MKANDSSSSATNPFEVDLLDRGMLPPLPSAWMKGEDLDLLEPLEFSSGTKLPAQRKAHGDRPALAKGLAVANAAYGHPAARALADKLADPETCVVVTGQQPGLLGGPLYGLTKMLAAVRWAEALEAAGRPAVAVFWVATEDHDWAEMAQAAMMQRNDLLQLSLGEDPSPLLPVGMRSLGDNLEVELERATEALAGSSEGIDIARRWYRPNARFGEAFCRYLVHLLQERAPLMLDSMLPEVKQLQQPWLRRLIDQRQTVETSLSEREATIEDCGYALQVKPQAQASPLFLLRGAERRRIIWADDGWFLRGLEEDVRPVSELLSTLQENPSVISPGVLARPAIQDALLGTTLQIMGPAEMTYMSQVSSVYPVLGIDPPATVLRPQVMVVEEKHAEHMESLHIGLAELLSEPIDELLTAKLGADVVAPLRAQIEVLLEALNEPVVDLDASLAKPLQKTQDQIGRALDQLQGKVAAAVGRRNEIWRRRLQQAQAHLLPSGGLQERTLAVAHFVNRYGADFSRILLDRLSLNPRQLQGLRWTPQPAGAKTRPAEAGAASSEAKA